MTKKELQDLRNMSYNDGYEDGFDDGIKAQISDTNFRSEWVDCVSLATGWEEGYKCRRCRSISKDKTKFCGSCGRLMKVDNDDGQRNHTNSKDLLA